MENQILLAIIIMYQNTVTGACHNEVPNIIPEILLYSSMTVTEVDTCQIFLLMLVFKKAEL